MKFKLKYKTVLFLPVFVLNIFVLQGQEGSIININSLHNSSGSLIEKQLQYIKDTYTAKIDAPKEIINGKEYEPYYRQSKSKPLLFNDKKRTATLFTKTRQFNNITLQYDTFLDEVIYTDNQRILFDRYPQIALNENLVEGFNLYFEDDSMKFRYFTKTICEKMNLTEGFYEVAYTGNSKLIIKHRSTIYERDGVKEYKYFPEYYINMKGTYSKMNSRKSFISLFGVKAEEIKKYLHASRIKIRRADKTQIAAVLKYYDSLTAESR